MTVIYQVRLMFEWGGGCLWCGNDSAFEKYGVGPIENTLPVSEATRNELHLLSAWHNKALDWDNPSGQSPWGKDEFKKFDAAAQLVKTQLQKELGSDYLVTYEPLGHFGI